jgi:Arc/MetJ-type ribon-helix-helix transcriptional regulator
VADTEKITINMSTVDLGQIDLLVDQGFYSNRTDFIRTAIRNQLAQHADTVKQTITSRTMVLGSVTYDRKDLEKALAEGKKKEIRVVGVLILKDDIPPELAAATIHSVEVFGVLRASDAVKNALLDRIK